MYRSPTQIFWFSLICFTAHISYIYYTIQSYCIYYLKTNGDVVTHWSINGGVHVNTVSLLVASKGVTSITLTLSPMTTGATSRRCNGPILSPEIIWGQTLWKIKLTYKFTKSPSTKLQSLYQNFQNGPHFMTFEYSYKWQPKVENFMWFKYLVAVNLFTTETCSRSKQHLTALTQISIRCFDHESAYVMHKFVT